MVSHIEKTSALVGRIKKTEWWIQKYFRWSVILINGKKRPKAGINANFLYFLYVPSK